MLEFTSIGSFRHAVKDIRGYCNSRGIPLPTVKYYGTVKLHGTNSGVRVTPDKIHPQSRSRTLAIDNDNFGFAAFTLNAARSALFGTLRDQFDLGDESITFFGEWVGSGIQKNVAVSNLPRHFVIFSANVANKYIPAHQFPQAIFSDSMLARFNSEGIYFINQAPTYIITVDYANPEHALMEIDKLTIAVEEKCPWGKMRGVDGIGEGIVWVPMDDDMLQHTSLWFKSKGLKHKEPDAKGYKTEVDPVKVLTISSVVGALLPDWRMEQGINELRQKGLALTTENTGAYLQWICRDILKEEQDVITANNLSWKDIVSSINRAARQYYLTEISKQL